MNTLPFLRTWLMLLALGALPVAAVGQEPPPRACRQAAEPIAALPSAAPVLPGVWVDRVTENRSRTIQIAFVAILIGVWMLRRT